MAALAGCQSTSTSEPQPAAPAAIEVRDAKGATVARVVAGRPCRATLAGQEFLIGGRPLVTMVGNVRWTGDDESTGTILKRDGEPVARIYPSTNSATEVALFEPGGIAMIRATVDGDKAVIIDRAGAVVRTARQTPAGITIGDMTVTGTNDLLLAAVLSAPEAELEVRGLAACHRLLPTEVKAAL